MKRVGWTKPNAFHICITSYKLVTQDHSSFRRKQWQYLILDEAQHIKNFKSQRWQLLLNFPSEGGRLLITGKNFQILFNPRVHSSLAIYDPRYLRIRVFTRVFFLIKKSLTQPF